MNKKKKKPSEIIKQVLKQYKSQLATEIEKAETLLHLYRISDAGRVLELALKNLLKPLLPQYVGITRGIIYSSDLEDDSEEIDLILYDNRYCSGFHVEENQYESISYIPIEVVLGIVSVKKTLDLKSLKDSINNINSVYELNRKPLKNQFHYDLNFNNTLEYKNGIEVNKIFSCLVSYSNNFLYCQKDGKKVKRTEEELIKYYDKMQTRDWFKNFTLDLIYSIDSTFFFPLSYNNDTNKWNRNVKIQNLGNNKKALCPRIENNELSFNIDDLVLSYSCDKENPEKLLGQFITYLQIYCSQLVKCSPNINTLFEKILKTEFETVTTERNIKKIKANE